MTSAIEQLGTGISPDAAANLVDVPPSGPGQTAELEEIFARFSCNWAHFEHCPVHGAADGDLG